MTTETTETARKLKAAYYHDVYATCVEFRELTLTLHARPHWLRDHNPQVGERVLLHAGSVMQGDIAEIDGSTVTLLMDPLYSSALRGLLYRVFVEPGLPRPEPTGYVYPEYPGFTGG